MLVRGTSWLVPVFLVGLALHPGAPAGEPEPLPSPDRLTRDLEHRPGLLDFHVDSRRGKVWLELPPPQGPRGEIGRYLYVEGLVSGLGSNPVGLDRGQLGKTRLIVLRRAGGRILVEVPNLSFRALGTDDAERGAVESSFATSVLWGGGIAAEGDDGTVIVDFTSFLVRDAHGVTSRMERAGQGAFTLDPARSALELDACLAFPRNLEFEASLTYAGEQPGDEVQSVAPVPESVTLRQHHTIAALPDDDYRPRLFDPRAGSFHIEFKDYAAALDQPLDRRWVVRHRLRKIHPERASSPVEEPLIYYVDPGTPEPVRSALLDGARWWSEAFEAAGFENAFRVELLPQGAHPLDLRYNVIQWVHRATRGWSYGGGVVDPRTGEMIKGHVSLGSLRVRQDRLLFEGLLGSDPTGSGSAADPLVLALARIRQLAAHEVGHTLGLSHNFAASTYGRASVMDYPAPLVRVDQNGALDVASAYSVGIGAWDVQAVRYAYSEFGEQVDEGEALKGIIDDGLERGMLYLSDDDARPAGAAQPLASLWDNGADAVEELRRVFEVRRVALRGFGERNVPEGQPLALLEETLVPIYLYHRYQLTAAAKTIGGVDYRHAVRGDGAAPMLPLDAGRQRAAVEALLEALDPGFLDLPERVLGNLRPRPDGFRRHREQFNGRAHPIFDSLAAAETAVDLVLDELFQPQRCARLVDQHTRRPELPGIAELMNRVRKAVFVAKDKGATARESELRRIVQRALADRLVRLGSDVDVAPAVRAEADRTLEAIAQTLGGETDTASSTYLEGRIRRYLERGYSEAPAAPALSAPPGSPIGHFCDMW